MNRCNTNNEKWFLTPEEMEKYQKIKKELLESPEDNLVYTGQLTTKK